MKILTNKEYDELINVVVQNEEVDKLKKQITKLEVESIKQEESYLRNKKHNAEDFEREKSQWKYNTEVEIANALKTQLEEIAKLKLDLGNATKEVEILNRAFDNMGFDVKDMKSILDKLVDGVVAKNTVQLIK